MGLTPADRQAVWNCKRKCRGAGVLLAGRGRKKNPLPFAAIRDCYLNSGESQNSDFGDCRKPLPLVMGDQMSG